MYSTTDWLLLSSFFACSYLSFIFLCFCFCFFARTFFARIFLLLIRYYFMINQYYLCMSQFLCHYFLLVFIFHKIILFSLQSDLSVDCCCCCCYSVSEFWCDVVSSFATEFNFLHIPLSIRSLSSIYIWYLFSFLH